MNKIIAYEVVEALDKIERFNEEVTLKLSEGWELHGELKFETINLGSLTKNLHFGYVQVMVKKEAVNDTE